MRGWARCGRGLPCPVCKRTDWCGIATDGTIAICMRVESPHASVNGGWVHRLQDVIDPARVPPPPAPPDKGRDWMREWEVSRTGLSERWAQLEVLATSLGVSPESLMTLGIGRVTGGWTFPMWDAAWNLCGLKMRTDSGRKIAVLGSRSGLIAPLYMRGAALDVGFVVEGESDCAAALSIGLHAVARPGCRSGWGIVKVWAKRWRRTVVVADSDAPGRTAASDLAKQLRAAGHCATVMFPLGHKDLRDWVAAGGNGRALCHKIGVAV